MCLFIFNRLTPADSLKNHLTGKKLWLRFDPKKNYMKLHHTKERTMTFRIILPSSFYFNEIFLSAAALRRLPVKALMP